jgi:hypothetical protein
MRRVFRLLNLVAGGACLASGAAASWSWLTDPGYRAHYGDSAWLLAAYVGFYLWVLHAFWRDDRWAPRLAVAKAIGAYVFLATFVSVGPLWMAVSPGRYVYLVFHDWGSGSQAPLMAYVLLGRGVWNTANVMVFTWPWWNRIRADRPIVGRLLTAVPILLMVVFVWTYRELLRLEHETFSAEAMGVAAEVLAGLDCDAIRNAPAPTTTDRRARGDRQYDVEIRWDCRDVRVRVLDPDGKLGTANAPRLECCPRPAAR